jgi:carbamoyl-phosphate synthase small subunit
MKALLMLEDSYCAECESFTGEGEVFGETVFNTALTGYQEIITDPSYAGQVVLMTNSMIGTYGIRYGEDESLRIHAEGFVVKEYGGEALQLAEGEHQIAMPVHPSYDGPCGKTQSKNARAEVVCSLADFLHAHKVLGVEGVDTGAFAKHIRERGAMKAGITTQTLDREVFLKKVLASSPVVGQDLVGRVSTQEPYLYSDGEGPRIAVLDCGIKLNTLRELAKRNCRVEVFPAYSSKKEILSTRPD